MRTAVALMGFGFVVAKFGLYLRLIAGHQPAPGSEAFALAIGLALVLLGVVTCALASMQYRRLVAELGPDEIPRGYRAGVAGACAYAVCTMGVLVAAYLAAA